MGSTVGALPYPEPTEPFGDGALNIKALAEAVTARLAIGQCGGLVVISSIGAGAVGSVTVTFPADRFTALPVVELSLSITAPQNPRGQHGDTHDDVMCPVLRQHDRRFW